jgi:S1-C subfamily serine protease
LNDAELEKDIAHFILNPGTVPFEGTPRLMVSLGVEKEKVVIQGFPHGSVSEKAGMRKGDVILALDGTRVKSIEDVRIELLFKKKGDRVKVKVSRKEPAGGDKEIDLEVVLR